MTTIGPGDLDALCREALRLAGAGEREAAVLAEATVEAERVGNRAVGVAHLFDYLDGYRHGRIATGVRPVIRRPAAGIVDADAAEGLAQTAFVDASDTLQQAIVEVGVAALWIRRSFTCGELGFYARRLAQHGFVSVAMANSPALMSLGGSPNRILGTNPLAFAVPRPGVLPFVVDQASASTAFVTIRRAAERGASIPAGWAIDADGEPTQDPARALDGALLPFGGHRGGNLALLIEILSTLSGASFSSDAPPFERGNANPGIGVFLLGIAADIFAGSLPRLTQQLRVLGEQHDVRLPALDLTMLAATIELDDDLLARLAAAATGRP